MDGWLKGAREAASKYPAVVEWDFSHSWREFPFSISLTARTYVIYFGQNTDVSNNVNGLI
jgi:hypothetical protein